MTSSLIIDTSNSHCAIALQLRGNLVKVIDDEPRSHAVKLLPNIHALLKRYECALPSLDFIAVVTGPGSFTGLRIGVGVAQGLAESAGLEVIGISSLQAQAFAAVNNRLVSSLETKIETDIEAVDNTEDSDERAGIAEKSESAKSTGSLEQTTVEPTEETETRVLVALEARSDEIYYASYQYQPAEKSYPQLQGNEAVAKLTEATFLTNSSSISLSGSGWKHQSELIQADKSLDSLLNKQKPSLYLDPYCMEDLSVLAALLYQHEGTQAGALVLPNYVQNQMPYKGSTQQAANRATKRTTA